MITAARIKLLRSLSVKKFRDSTGLFLVEGEKMVSEALSSGFEVEEVLRRAEVGEDVMRRISSFDSPPPVAAVVRKRPSCNDATPPGGLCVALDAVRDPGNMGTIIRTCDWFGVSALYVSPDCADIYNPKVVASSMGAIFRVNVVEAGLADVCRAFNGRGLPVFGTFLDGEPIYEAPSLPSEALIIMGNEARGISAGLQSATDFRRLTIPSFGGRSESLNVAVATAITLSEFRRRG